MANYMAKAQSALAAGDIEQAKSFFVKEIKRSSFAPKTTTAAALLLKDNGQFDAAFSVLEFHLSKGKADSLVMETMALFAMDLETYDVALKLLNALIEMAPDKPSHYVNYCTCLIKTGAVEQAISLIQAVLPQMPEAHSLWNLLGTILSDDLNDKKAAEPFFLEAFRLAPDDLNVATNLGNIYSAEEKCRDYYQAAIDNHPEAPEPHIGLAIRFFLDERWKEAFPHYEYRLKTNQGLSKSPTYEPQAPIWQGEPLGGKSILVMAEQGIGDELFFSLNFRRLLHDAGTVILSCDDRLKSIFARSFSTVKVIGYHDAENGSVRTRSFPELTSKNLIPDFAIHAGSLMQHYWPEPTSIAPLVEPVLKPDQHSVDMFGKLMEASGSGRKRVGLSWRSGNLSGDRQWAYSSLEAFVDIINEPNIDFYALQYDMTPEETEHLKTHLPNVKIFEDIDLKQDMEANLAIISNLDHIVGPCTTTQVLAMLANKPVAFLTKGLPWWSARRRRAAGPFFAQKCTWHFIQSQDWQANVKNLISAD